MTNKNSRRHFLRGTGVALALPWMESLPLFASTASTAKKAAAANQPPLRFACLYFSNGVEPIHWWAKGDGKEITEVGEALTPMLPHGKDYTFLRGLYNQKALESTSPHLGRMPNVLSGETVSLDPSNIRVGTTFDQILSQRIGNQTKIPSMALGIEPNELRLEDGVSMIYGSALSWATPTRPATKEIYPARAFDLLVGDGSGRKLDRSVLDSVLREMNDLQPKISSSDRHKLDEYLTSIRDVENRIERAAKEDRLEGEGWRPTLKKANIDRPADSIPQNVPDHMKIMLDLMVLAFQMDKTRLMTIMLNNDLSQMNFSFLKDVEGALHLDLTHNGKEAKAEAMYLQTNKFHIAQFAYLVNRLKEIKEGEQSLLDNSMLLCCSNLFDGDTHSADEMPMLLAGRGGGLKPGQIIDYREKGNDNRRACSLYLSLMDRMGVELDKFGDTSKRLVEI